MKGIERINVAMTRPQQTEARFPTRNPYAMDVNRGRNCYSCRRFRHMAQHCRNRGQRRRVTEERRLEYGGRRERNYKHLDNLKEVENLEFLN